MKIGIIAAMSKEMDLLLPLIKDITEYKVRKRYSIYCGYLGNHYISVIQSGIGKVNAAISALTLIESERPDLIINIGVAGGTDASMHVLDFLVADSVSYYDVWCGDGTEYGAADGFDAIMLPDKKIIEIAHKVLDEDNIKYGLICSGDKFICTVEEVNEIKSNFPTALAVDMESGAIAQICSMFEVPFNIMRVISDTPGQSENISQYENFWSDAPKQSFENLCKIISVL